MHAILLSMTEVLMNVFLYTAYAQTPTAIHPPGSCDFISGGFLSGPGSMFACTGDYIAQLTFILIGFTASISLTALIINGFRYMIGPAIPGGSSDAAKKGIAAALTGLIVSLLTYIILDTFIALITQ